MYRIRKVLVITLRWCGAVCLSFALPLSPPAGITAASKLPPTIEVDEEKEKLPAARQNALLRQFFKRQYLRLRRKSHDLNTFFLDAYVDRQIDRFLQDIQRKLEELHRSLRHSAEMREQWSRESPGPAARGRQRSLFERALKELEDRTGDLHGMLALVLPSLKSKQALPRSMDPCSPANFYEEEMRFIEAQVTEADLRIRDYLFDATNTVRVENLRCDNMMIRLHRAKEMAKQIRRELR